MNIPVLEIFRESVSMINYYSSDSVLVIDNIIIEKTANILR